MSSHPTNRYLFLVSVCALAMHTASAEEQSGNNVRPVIEEVIVTAQRRAESLQEVPIAVNVMQGEDLTKMGVMNTSDLQAAVPGLEFTTTGPAGTPFLRGVGSNAGNPNDEPSVALYIDGVYVGASFANVMSFNNIERVEVLKGPQGTLFGRNATGGVIQIVTRNPQQDTLVEVTGGVGNYRSSQAGFYATTGLTDTLAVDIAIQAETQDEGFGENITTGAEEYESQSFSARSKWLFTPTDRLTLSLALDHADTTRANTAYKLPEGALSISGNPGPGEFDSPANITLQGKGQPEVVARQTGVALRAEYELNNLQLVSISSYRDSSGTYWADADGSSAPWVEGKLPLTAKNYAQEFQLLSGPESLFDWVAGAYLYHAESGYEDVIFSGFAFAQPAPDGTTIGQLQLDGIQTSDSHSVYGQGSYGITADTEFTAGLRYTHERQEFDSAIFGTPAPKPNDRGFDEITWRIALDHAFTNNVHSYISWNRGIKGGGFDVLSPGGPGFEPEELDAFELGLKSEWLNRSLRLNAAYFFYDYKNIQVQIIQPGGTGIISTTNAAEAEISGLDLDFTYLLTNTFSLSGGLVYIDSEYKDYTTAVAYPESPTMGGPAGIDASGNRTIRTPKFSATLTAEYRMRSSVGEFPFSVTISNNGGYYFDAENRFEQDAHTVVNASAGWLSPDKKYSVSLWARNLNDEYYYAQGVPSNFGDLIIPAAPRTYGISFKVAFGS